jgi:hypothetical protein
VALLQAISSCPEDFCTQRFCQRLETAVDGDPDELGVACHPAAVCYACACS